MPMMFDMLECGDDCSCCDRGNSRGLIDEIVGMLRGDDRRDMFQTPNEFFDEVRLNGSQMRSGGRSDIDRRVRAAGTLRALEAISDDPDPTPVNSIFPTSRQLLDDDLPDRLSTGPQTAAELVQFGIQPAFDDPTGQDLRTQIRRLLRS